MIKFEDDKVLLLHQLIIESTGGTSGIKDITLLDSAINSCYQTFDGKGASLDIFWCPIMLLSMGIKELEFL